MTRKKNADPEPSVAKASNRWKVAPVRRVKLEIDPGELAAQSAGSTTAQDLGRIGSSPRNG